MKSMGLQVHFLLIGLFGPGALIGGRIKMRDCPPGTKGGPIGGNQLTLNGVAVQDCDKEPCNLYMQENYIIELNATLHFSAKKLLYSMIAMFPGDVELPVIEDQNMCEVLVFGSCQEIVPGSKIGANRSIIFDSYFPLYSGTCRTIIKDEDMVPQYCGDFNIYVKKKVGIPSALKSSPLPGIVPLGR